MKNVLNTTKADGFWMIALRFTYRDFYANNSGLQKLLEAYSTNGIELNFITQKQINDEFTDIWLPIFNTDYFKFAQRVQRPNRIYGKSYCSRISYTEIDLKII